MFEAILIAGPTASGKSAAALALADRLGGTVINADSMQVYRDLHVVTARPSAEDMRGLPHRLYGTVAGAEAYSVGHWVEDAKAIIEDVRAAGRVPIVVGGTGLYFMALLNGLSPVPSIPDEVRQSWRKQAAKMPAAELHGVLTERDPVMAARLKPSDTQRIVRALEVFDATGVSLAEWQEATGAPVLQDDRVLKIVVAPEREALYAAADTRFDAMLKEGALSEVEQLLSLDLEPGLPVMRAHGVPELGAHLAGIMTLEEAAKNAKTATRRYAKRQMTWARRFMNDWSWVPNSRAAAELAG